MVACAAVAGGLPRLSRGYHSKLASHPHCAAVRELTKVNDPKRADQSDHIYEYTSLPSPASFLTHHLRQLQRHVKFNDNKFGPPAQNYCLASNRVSWKSVGIYLASRLVTGLSLRPLILPWCLGTNGLHMPFCDGRGAINQPDPAEGIMRAAHTGFLSTGLRPNIQRLARRVQPLTPKRGAPQARRSSLPALEAQ